MWAHFQPSDAVSDLLWQVQDQHTQSLRYEFLDLPDLVRNCTSWPLGTEFGSIVQHQNFDMNYKLPLDGLESEFSLRASFNPLDELWIFTYPMDTKLLVQVCVSSNVMEESRATDLLDKLCKAISSFATSSDRPLSDMEH